MPLIVSLPLETVNRNVLRSPFHRKRLIMAARRIAHTRHYYHVALNPVARNDRVYRPLAQEGYLPRAVGPEEERPR